MAFNAIPSLDKNFMRAINRYQVLNTIRNRKLISRADISRETGLSRASVTNITAQLIEDELLLEKEEGDSIGGRRPILLELNPDGAYTLGVHLSFQNISVVIINLKADILAQHFVPFDAHDTSPEDMAEKIAQAVHQCMWTTELSKKKISGVGLAIHGLVDSLTGLIRYLPNYQWKNVDFKSILQQKLQIPIYIDNSSNNLALTEQWFGAGKDVDNFIVVNLAHGLGTGIVINGQVYMGHTGIAGEFGHTTIDPSGPLCRCGKRGCLEAYVGDYAIIANAKELARQGAWQTENPDQLTIDDIIASAQAGEATLVDLYARTGHMLGIGIANLISIFNPARVIISGKGTEAGGLLFDSMNRSLANYISGDMDEPVEIVIPRWKNTDTARGAGVLVLREIYKFPSKRVKPDQK